MGTTANWASAGQLADGLSEESSHLHISGQKERQNGAESDQISRKRRLFMVVSTAADFFL